MSIIFGSGGFSGAPHLSSIASGGASIASVPVGQLFSGTQIPFTIAGKRTIEKDSLRVGSDPEWWFTLDQLVKRIFNGVLDTSVTRHGPVVRSQWLVLREPEVHVQADLTKAACVLSFIATSPVPAKNGGTSNISILRDAYAALNPEHTGVYVGFLSCAKETLDTELNPSTCPATTDNGNIYIKVKGLGLWKVNSEWQASVPQHIIDNLNPREPTPPYEPPPEPTVYCDKCQNEIDPDVCHCGSGPNDSEHGGSILTYTHPFIPMGCTCHYAKDCPTCKGTGLGQRDIFSNEIRCPDCNGTGQSINSPSKAESELILTEAAGGLPDTSVTCFACDDSGISNGKPCLSCSTVSTPSAPACDTCNDTGYDANRNLCPDCVCKDLDNATPNLCILCNVDREVCGHFSSGNEV